ncbi:hypothetical protein H5P36_08025 [Bacillus sp. APMAM]|nr:hypothetical protein [Bacillus sp. APMAM]RTZ56503.1 hypothetical protein EKO25_07670 [Bacillus sp. SAJ1]
MRKDKSLYWKILQFILLVMFMFSLSACHHRENKITTTHKQSTKSPYDKVKPLIIEEDSFQKIVGWLNNNTVVYVAEDKNNTNIYRYNLLDGQKHILYTSDNPVKNVVIAPDKKKLLIHSASLTYMAEINVINLNGKVLFTRKVPSYDLSFDWNNNNPDLILTTVFFEDWSYQVHVLDVKNRTFKKYPAADPFVKWFNGDGILFQDWKDNEMHFFAPLRSVSLSGSDLAKTLFPRIYKFAAYSPYLMTITIPENHKDQAVYHFYNQELNELFTFEVPHLNQYDNWLVPNYDFLRNQFLTFVPSEGGSIDEYSGKFQLIQFDIQRKEKKLITDKLKNQPISLSPDGTMCLYGNQLNQLINLNNGKIKSIVEYEKNGP